MYKHAPLKKTFSWVDLFVLSFLVLLFYGLIQVAQEWAGHDQPAVTIDLSLWSLPKYAFFSLVRAFAAYGLSLLFSISYGYAAAKSKTGEKVLIPLLDILQSIPVLGFLPGLVMALVALFPNSDAGVELSCILMIFTGQAWNMTFSFYASIKSVPSDYRELASVLRLSWLQRLKRIELPHSATGLVWNSLMSMAGGWFFLTICESFQLGDKRFRLRGLGAFMSEALDQGDYMAAACGAGVMCAVILFVDLLVWRPVMVWVRKFHVEAEGPSPSETTYMSHLLKESWTVRWFQEFFSQRKYLRMAKRSRESVSLVTQKKLLARQGARQKRRRVWWEKRGEPWLRRLVLPFFVLMVLWAGTRLWELIRTLDFEQWKLIAVSLLWTFWRVMAALGLVILWAVPFGVIVGRSRRLTRWVQPLVQLAASFPAPMLYPVVLLVLLKAHVSLSIISMLLLFLGVQWYVVFNVIGGASTISRELKDSLDMVGVKPLKQWVMLYLPSIFPFLVTGLITAAGGAWNASIVAEAIQFGGKTWVVPGIGSLLSRASSEGNLPLLCGALCALVCVVVAMNRLFWRRLYMMAEKRFRYEGL